MVALIILVLMLIYFLQKNNNDSQTQKQAEAVRQAQQYVPTGFCTQALVPAVHISTGAKYTFNSGCLAPGWKSE